MIGESSSFDTRTSFSKRRAAIPAQRRDGSGLRSAGVGSD
jgi:hypothetical protein